jgi:hypothetical protein
MRNFDVYKCRKPILEICVDSFAVEENLVTPVPKLHCREEVLGEGNLNAVLFLDTIFLTSLSEPAYLSWYSDWLEVALQGFNSRQGQEIFSTLQRPN